MSNYLPPVFMKQLLILALAGLFMALEVNALEAGNPAPTCPVSANGKDTKLTLNDYKGKVVYLDFWASWCPPCKKSFPWLSELWNELHKQGFDIVAVNVDENREDALRFLEETPVPFKIVMDPEGKCPSNYSVKAMPSSYIIDKNGIIRHVHLGFRSDDADELREKILALLSDK